MVDAGSPQWTDEDTALALAWKRYEASLCSGCGYERELCEAPGADDDWTAVAVGCHACAAATHAKTKFHEGGEGAAGVRFFVRHDPRG